MVYKGFISILVTISVLLISHTINGILLPSSVPYNVLHSFGSNKHKQTIYSNEPQYSSSIFDPDNKNKNFVKGVIEILTNTMNRFVVGTKDFIKQAAEVERLKKVKSKYGDEALTYTQFKLLEQSKDDFGKLFRIGITIPISPQIFFYSYLVFPMMAGQSPWVCKCCMMGHVAYIIFT